MECFEEEYDDVEHLLCECLDLLDILLLLWEDEEDLVEEEKEDDLCLLFIFVLCFVLGKYLLLRLDWDMCLSADTQVLQSGSIVILGSDNWLNLALEAVILSLR